MAAPAINKRMGPRRLQQLRNLARRPLRQKVLILQVVILLGVNRVLIDRLPFARLEKMLGTRQQESPPTMRAAEIRYVKQVAWAVRKVHPHTPWESNCFPQALTAKYLLQRRGIRSTLYLGASFKDTTARRELMAHAWLRCGKMYLTGGDSRNDYGAIVSYS